MKSFHSGSLAWAVLCGCVLVTGCGAGGPKMNPVSGKVTSKGAPVDGALVVFHPIARQKVNDAKPVATTAADGTFQLTTFALNDGAEVGEYGVTIVWNKPVKEATMSLSSEGDASGPDRLQGRYGNPATPVLKAKVEAGGTNLFDFEVE